MKAMFNYSDNKRILLAEEAEERSNIKANFALLTDQDIFALKSIYDFEYVNTNLIQRYLKDKITGYRFKSCLRKYINLGFIGSYYIISKDGERTSNIHVLTKEAAKLFEEHFSLDINDKNHFRTRTPSDADILYILKKLALNQYLIGSNDFIREYKLSNNMHFDAMVYFKDNRNEFYIKILRSNNNNREEMYNTIKYVNSVHSKYKKVVFIFEDLYHLEEVAGPYLSHKYRKEILFQIDRWALDFPESYTTIDYPEENCAIYGELNIWELKD